MGSACGASRRRHGRSDRARGAAGRAGGERVSSHTCRSRRAQAFEYSVAGKRTSTSVLPASGPSARPVSRAGLRPYADANRAISPAWPTRLTGWRSRPFRSSSATGRAFSATVCPLGSGCWSARPRASTARSLSSMTESAEPGNVLAIIRDHVKVTAGSPCASVVDQRSRARACPVLVSRLPTFASCGDTPAGDRLPGA